jgi:5'-nucleotidase
MSFDVFVDTLPVVLVDMDGVLADFDSEIIARLKSKYPHVPILKERVNHYISKDYQEHEELVKALCDEEGFFESLPLVDHAIEGWQRLLDLEYHPIICSSPLETSPSSRTEKLNWLRQHIVPVFGQWVVDQAVLTPDKHLFDAVALIDDNPRMENSEKATWKHIVFDQEYNRSNIDQPRLRGWLDIALPELLKTARK